MSDNTNTVVLSDDNWQTEVLDDSGIVMVDVWAAWCGPCRLLSPVIEELADEFEGKVKIGKLNADDNKKAFELRVSAIPTVLFFKAGDEHDRVIGAVPKEHLADRLNSLLEK